MNIKKILGIAIAFMGIGGMVYSTTLYVMKSDGYHLDAFVAYGIISLIFIVSGIAMINKTPG